MPTVNAVLFDLGGTLINYDGSWADALPLADQALFDALQADGIQLERDRFMNEFRSRLELYYRERESEFIEYTTRNTLSMLLAEWGYPDVQAYILDRSLAAMYAITQADWKIEPDAMGTLANLKQRGLKLGILSNAGDDADVQTLVDQSNLRDFFDFVYSSATMRVRKPNPAFFQVALDAWQFSPDQVVMVGDTLGADILGAQLSGIRSIWVTRRADTPANRAHQETIQPDFTIASLADLPELLEKLNSA